MKLLVLGGTRFLGRHLVDAALARGHDVTIFTRGVHAGALGRRGHAPRRQSRSRASRPASAALATGTWDAAIDTSGYVPRCVGRRPRLLDGRVGHYMFVSSLSVYADASRPGIDETAPVATLDDPASEDIAAHYGALKARCEDEVRAAFGDRALVVRPGLIVGPHDPTDRFALLGRAVPAPATARRRAPTPRSCRRRRSAPVQFIDARDLAAWMLDLRRKRRAAGTFNACSPAGTWTMGALVDALVARGARAGSAPVPAWIDEATLARARRRALDRAAAVDSRDRSRSRPASWNSPAPRDRARACASGRSRRRSTTRRRGSRSATTPARGATCCRPTGARDAGRRRRRRIARGRRAIIATARATRAASHEPPAHADFLEFALRTARGRRRGHPAALPRRARRRGQGRRQRATTRSPSPITRPKTVIRARDRARVSRPRHPRRGARLAEGARRSYTWVIDPIDGTRSFILGQMHWATLIALHDGDGVVAGVAHQPYVGEIVRRRRRAARRDGGAAASGARCGRAAARRVGDAVVACTDPKMFRTPASARRSTASPTARG